jgi:hypothetical protein
VFPQTVYGEDGKEEKGDERLRREDHIDLQDPSWITIDHVIGIRRLA